MAIQNHNPGNIRWSIFNNWKGQTGKDDRGFCYFESDYYGYRAMCKLIRNYINGGDNTIRKIITKYAPATENTTGTYINTVSQATGTDPDAVLVFEGISDMPYGYQEFKSVLPVISAMVKVESGVDADKDTLLFAFNNVYESPENPAFAGFMLPVADVEAIDPKFATIALIVFVLIAFAITQYA